MLQWIETAMAHPGFVWLMFAGGLAGLVRGFSGFGSGLVYMPIAVLFLTPPQAVAVIVLVDLIGPLMNLPNAMKIANRREIGTLGIGLLPGLMIGFVGLFFLPAEVFRWGVCIMSLATVIALVSGWQWRGRRGPRETLAVGFVAGITGGATALPGPPVVLYYMASPLPVAQVRANLTIFMLTVDLCMIVILAASHSLTPLTITLSCLLLGPFMACNAIGSWLFRPDWAKAYKYVSWGLIAASALMGLPLWT